MRKIVKVFIENNGVRVECGTVISGHISQSYKTTKSSGGVLEQMKPLNTGVCKIENLIMEFDEFESSIRANGILLLMADGDVIHAPKHSVSFEETGQSPLLAFIWA